MVGVPRSKGCHACRKQKIKCSQEQPGCAICIRAGRTCPGYERDRVFVQVEPPSADSTTGKPRTRRVPASRTKVAPVLVASRTARPTWTSSNIDKSVFDEAPALITPRNMALAAYRQQLLGAMLGRFQNSRPGTPVLQDRHQHWLLAVKDRGNMSQALDVAATAFCTAKLGRIGEDGALIKQSLQLYTRGLRELQAALYDPSLMWADDTLGACVLLAMYEVFECPSRSLKGYRSHIQGCARLMELRGPEAHVDGLGHAIFTSFRFMASFEVFVNQRSFLTEPAWKEVPFKHQPKSGIHQLLDLLLEGPALFKQGEAIQYLPTFALQLEALVKLVDTLWDLEGQLQSFYTRLVAEHGETFWEVSTRPGELAYGLFSTRLAFPDIHIAGTMTLFWAMQTLLKTAICRLYPNVWQAQRRAMLEKKIDRDTGPLEFVEPGNLSAETEEEASNANPASEPSELEHKGSETSSIKEMEPPDPNTLSLPPLTAAQAWPEHARAVCRSADYCLGDMSTELGIGAMSAPLNIVLVQLKEQAGFEAEVKWIQATITRMAARVGLLAFLESR